LACTSEAVLASLLVLVLVVVVLEVSVSPVAAAAVVVVEVVTPFVLLLKVYRSEVSRAALQQCPSCHTTASTTGPGAQESRNYGSKSTK
jgi:hypothetical protein